ncbi:thioesterase [Mucilaginibacter phyllosphaerae]|uniref:Thioesterase n=1 Tax=Mucilaginibacter phyllosphaerae TaxID=1812349 RepID=A0A4Y8A6H0_9SPHI|nr:thioesterase [Mucilaginibacter phyllosphaerae]
MWSQIDANQHMRHSAYADVAAQARLNMLGGVGLNPVKLFEYRVGPVLFKEELFYLREIALGELIKVSCQVSRSRADGSRWSIRHEIFRADGVKAALINADGAWIDMDKRRLTLLPPELGNLFAHAPLSDDYTEDIPNSKQ